MPGIEHRLIHLFAIAPLALWAQVPLPIPDTLSGSSINLTVQEGTWEFHAGEMVNTYGYNGDLLGPTLLLEQGGTVTLNVTNALPDLTTTHWHGLVCERGERRRPPFADLSEHHMEPILHGVGPGQHFLVPSPWPWAH
ncbi:MAG: multicopper oxidase domain-containing protein, partial [Flavobacteriales bacterium]|nr:multicopper oxidase domain-containing protein [Flavobacteriales bacterium]